MQKGVGEEWIRQFLRGFTGSNLSSGPDLAGWAHSGNIMDSLSSIQPECSLFVMLSEVLDSECKIYMLY